MKSSITLTTLFVLSLSALFFAAPALAAPDSVELVRNPDRVIIRCNGSGSVADDADYDVLTALGKTSLRIRLVTYVSDTIGDVLVLETGDDDWIEPPLTIQNADQPMRGALLHREVRALYIDEMSAGGICIIYLY